MNHIQSYPSIYQLGHRAVKGMFESPVIIEEKIDGSQFSFGAMDGVLSCRSKGQDIVVDAPEKMFLQAVGTAKSLADKLQNGWIYRGEYLQSPKHNTLAYGRVPNRHIIIFDVMTAPETYLSPESKRAEADRLGLECVPVLFQGIATDLDSISELIDKESVLGGVKMEGAVIKNYNVFTPDKKISLCKWVSAEFKEKHKVEWKNTNPTRSDVVQLLITELKTEARWKKAVQHLREAGQIQDDPKDIGPLIRELNDDVVKEESDYIKERLFNHFWPTINRGINNGFPQWYKEQLAQNSGLVAEPQSYTELNGL